jgi:TldD protein
MASILGQTLAPATELDRAMGYLANDDGSSFLDDPLAMLGSYQLGSSLVNMTANRSMPGGGANVKWDEEGVEPTDTPLVTKGILTDFQTTRESASWLAPYYQKTGRPVRSSGAAAAAEAALVPRSTGANYVLAPDPSHDTTFDELVLQTKSGYAVKGGSAHGDFQALNGTISGDVVYEIVNGKLGSAVAGAQVSFRAPEFWKNVAALGGARSVLSSGIRIESRGRSRREFTSGYNIGFNIQTVPAVVTQLAVTDTTRHSGPSASMIMPIEVN